VRDWKSEIDNCTRTPLPEDLATLEARKQWMDFEPLRSLALCLYVCLSLQASADKPDWRRLRKSLYDTHTRVTRAGNRLFDLCVQDSKWRLAIEVGERLMSALETLELGAHPVCGLLVASSSSSSSPIVQIFPLIYLYNLPAR
jgi:hypothetical protein